MSEEGGIATAAAAQDGSVEPPTEPPIEPKGKWSSLLPRLATAIVFAVVCLVPLYYGGWWWAALLMIGGLRVAYEWIRMSGLPELGRLMMGFGVALAFAIIIPLGLLSDVGVRGPVFYALMAGVLLIPLLALIGSGADVRRRRLVMGSFYILLSIASAAWLRGFGAGFEDDGFRRVLFVILVVIAADAGAYFAGKTIGGPKFIPKLSPNKTWAGFFGGLVIGSLLAGFLAEWMSDDFFEGLFVGAVLVVAAVAGDFLESGIKRRFGVKDSGTLLPGHGGVLDRIDSHMAALVVAAVVIAFAPGLSPV